METSCSVLLRELKIVWDEVGETEEEKDKFLIDIEQECLDVYKRRLDQANRSRAKLRQAIAVAEAEVATLCSVLGEQPLRRKGSGNLREEQRCVSTELEEMRKMKFERLNQFNEAIDQIRHVSIELQYNPPLTSFDESDLSTKKLGEFNQKLLSLQKEKSERLKQSLDLLNALNSLCLVLGIDFRQTVNEVHPSLDVSNGSKSLGMDTIKRLSSAVERLRDVKTRKMQKLQDLASTMLELWSLMDTPMEEQQMFQNVTRHVAASEQEITEPNMLSEEFIKQVEAQVNSLEELKTSKMKELVLKKKAELNEIRRRAHMVAGSNDDIEFAVEVIENGAINPSLVLEQVELQMSVVKEDAISRKEILEKVEKWFLACEEETWLEQYNRDENRYRAGRRGGHLALKRAERARNVISRIPAIVEFLITKIAEWEKERGMEFTYDGVRLLPALEEYNILRKEKGEERKKQRDQKKNQGQMAAAADVPAASRYQTDKKKTKTTTKTTNGESKPDAKRSTAVDDDATSSAGSIDLDFFGFPLKKLPLEIESKSKTVKSPPIASKSRPGAHNKPVNGAASDGGTPKTPITTPSPRTPITRPRTPIARPRTPTTPSMTMTVQPETTTWSPEKNKESREYSFEEMRLTSLFKNIL